MFTNSTVPIELFADRLMLGQSPDNYPNHAWQGRKVSYELWDEYYTGQVLNKLEGELLKFPAQINLVRPAVQAHASLLLGQYDDTILKFGIRKSLGIEDGVAKNATEMMNKLWAINSGDQKMLEQAILQQIFGGFYFAIRWKSTKKYPINYVPVDPRNIFPVWDGDDYERLVAVDVHTQISKPLAEARYGASAQYGNNMETSNLHEHWNENEYYVEIDGKLAKWPDGSEMKGTNPFLCPITLRPIIPFVYAPRVRSGEYFGESLVTSIMGAQDEFNGLLADVSNGITDAMRQKVWVRNRPKGKQDLDSTKADIWDLGNQQSGTPNPPEVGRLDGADIPPSVTEYVTNQLLSIIRMAHGMPDVAYGDTDSSVRSALTLNYMMWPATSLGRIYRQNTAVALKELNYKAMVMANSKSAWQSDFSVGEGEIEAVLVAHRTQFPPMLPQDRNDQISEVVQRLSAKVMSKRHAISLLDGEDEVEDELALIEEDGQAEMDKMMAQQEQSAEIVADNAPPTKPMAKNTSNTAQAAGGRAKGNSK